MPTTFYLSNGSVQAEPKPNVFVNPAGWALQVATSYAGAGEEGRLLPTMRGSTSHRDMASPATIGYYVMTRFASPKLAAQTILAQTVQAIMSGFEDLATANAEWAVQIFVWKADDTGVRGPVLYLPTQFTEMNADAETETSASATSTEVICLDGDRLIVEVYYSKTAAKLEALSRHHYGPADVSGYTSRIIFANNVTLLTEIKGFSDTGHGADAFSKTITLLNKGFSDVGHGSDTFAVILRVLSFSDVGQGLDTFSKVTTFQTKSFTDSSLGSDVFINPYRAMSFIDSGLGSDVFTNPFRALSFLDSGLGSEVFQKQILPAYIDKSFTDSGLGADSFIKSITFQLKTFSDIGGGNDVFTNPFRAMGFSDSGQGADVFTIVFKTVFFSDACSGADVFSNEITFLNKSFSDSGLGLDAYNISFKAIQFTDSGSGLDSYNIPFKTMGFSDSGYGADVFRLVFKTIFFSDVGSGVEWFTKQILGVPINKAFIDSGSGIDSFGGYKFNFIGGIVQINPANWSPVATFKFEATIKYGGGTDKAYAWIYNLTDNVKIAESEVSTDSTEYVRLTSANLGLSGVKEYRVHISVQLGETMKIILAKIRVTQ